MVEALKALSRVKILSLEIFVYNFIRIIVDRIRKGPTSIYRDGDEFRI